MVPMTHMELKQLHTKQLMDRRRAFYKFWDRDKKAIASRFGNGETFGPVPQALLPGHLGYYGGTEAQALDEVLCIGAILATREHVPNKAEARKIRQKAAKDKRR